MDQPLLLLPHPRTLSREIKGGGPSALPTLRSKEDQRSFLDGRFERLEHRFFRRPAKVRSSPSGFRPEEVVVVTLRGDVDRLQETLSSIPGIEYFFDFAGGDVEDELAAGENARAYIASTDDGALEELLKFYRWYKKFDGQNLPHGKAPLRHFFEQIEEIRYWDASDRLEHTNIIPYLRSQIDAHKQMIPFELQFWFRQNSSRRQSIEAYWLKMARENNGEVLRTACIPEIQYHAMLLRMPRDVVADILERKDVVFISESSVWLLQDVGQSVDPHHSVDEFADSPEHLTPVDAPRKPPVAALFDTLPVANHPALTDLVDVEDPDGWGASVAVAQRGHGTAMASLILHGDLQNNNHPLDRTLICIPVLKPAGSNHCAFPEDELIVDLIHRRVQALMNSPNGRYIRLINLSLGDPTVLLDRTISKLARIVDYLAFKHRVLFIISAGNVSSSFALPAGEEFASITTEELAAYALDAAAAARANRRIISPADAINGLTIGALYDDASTAELGPAFRLISRHRFFPAPYSREGAGFRNSVKPDIAFPGGRIAFREGVVPQSVNETTNRPGQRAAHPLGAYVQVCGTSNSAALATRHAVLGFEVLEELRAAHGYDIPEENEAVLLKALLASGADSRQVIDALAAVGLGEEEAVSAALLATGYGGFNSERFARCTDHRAILFGVGELTVDRADEYIIPIPSSLSGVSATRRLTLTLAYLSPINTASHRYRRARLSIEVRQPDLASALGVNGARPERNLAARGTLQQVSFEGRTIVANPEGALRIQVECRDHAGLEAETRIPYALVMNLEVDAEAGIPLYEDVRAALAVAPAPIDVPALVTSPKSGTIAEK